MQRRAAFVKMQSQIKQFNATGLFTYTLKTRFSDVFRGVWVGEGGVGGGLKRDQWHQMG